MPPSHTSLPHLIVGGECSSKIVMLFLSLGLSCLQLALCSQLIKSGENYNIFYPFRQQKSHPRPLLAPPKVWIQSFQSQMEYLQHLVVLEGSKKGPQISPINLYLQTLKNYIVGDYLGVYDQSVEQKLQDVKRLHISPIAPGAREEGLDWPLFAMTMAGRVRLETIKTIAEDIITNKVPGDIVETGVWRGGLSTVFLQF
jgi:hypothetical protein